jgi:hypothetical protein
MTTNPIGSVKEQAKRWASGRSAKADEPQRETRNVRDLKILGRLSRSTFAQTKDGRELKLRGPIMAHELERAGPDAILVTQPVRASDGRPRTDIYLATVVEPGTFAKLSKQKQYKPKERARGPVDGLLELRRPAARQFVRLAPDDQSDKGIIMGALSKRPLSLWTDSRSTPATVRRLIEVVNAAGGNLRRHGGHTLADWTHVGQWRALLIAAWPLVDAHMAGTPLRCQYEHAGEAPPADTLDLAGGPVCNACVGWEPDAA